ETDHGVMSSFGMIKIATAFEPFIARNGIYEEEIREKQMLNQRQAVSPPARFVDSRRVLVGAAGLEPATLCLEGRCSIHLSYVPHSSATPPEESLVAYVERRSYSRKYLTPALRSAVAQTFLKVV